MSAEGVGVSGATAGAPASAKASTISVARPAICTDSRHSQNECRLVGWPSTSTRTSTSRKPSAAEPSPSSARSSALVSTVLRLRRSDAVVLTTASSMRRSLRRNRSAVGGIASGGAAARSGNQSVVPWEQRPRASGGTLRSKTVCSIQSGTSAPKRPCGGAVSNRNEKPRDSTCGESLTAKHDLKPRPLRPIDAEFDLVLAPRSQMARTSAALNPTSLDWNVTERPSTSNSTSRRGRSSSDRSYVASSAFWMISASRWPAAL
eukprot:3406439-Prymnesium_polylepis.1